MKQPDYTHTISDISNLSCRKRDYSLSYYFFHLHTFPGKKASDIGAGIEMIFDSSALSSKKALSSDPKKKNY